MPTIAHAKLQDVGKMYFKAETRSGHEIEMDGLPPVGGEDRAARPAELPFAGLAGCTGMDTISILRKMRQDVTGFEVEVAGIKQAEDHPKIWQEIRVIFHVQGTVEPAKLEKAIDLSRTRYCSVSAIMKDTVKIHYSYSLNGQTKAMPDSE